MLKTKWIFEQKEKDGDWVRLCIISYDPERPDQKITEESYDFWMKSFSPPLNLVSEYKLWLLSLEEYKRKYLEYIKSYNIAPKVEKLANMARGEIITILCESSYSSECWILAEECERYEPDLKVIHE